jgi:hypothetical protein
VMQSTDEKSKRLCLVFGSSDVAIRVQIRI